MINKNQLSIINSKDKYIYINAGAGTGKTFTICQKIIKLLSESNYKILCLTFTDMACQEIKRRLKKYDVIVKTFHKYILDIINTNNKYTLIENYDNLPNEAMLKISRYKNGLTKIKPFFYNSYEKDKIKLNLIDFDDIFLIYLKSKIHKEHFDYVFIDEFQDTNNLQYKVLKKIIDNNTSVICVGDSYQSIYRFRGSNYKVCEKFISEFNASQFNLNENYRSDGSIIALANYLLGKKRLISTKPETKCISISEFDNIENETTVIINKINELISRGVESKEICVLARTNERLKDLQREWENSVYSVSILESNLFRTIHSVKGLEYEYVFLIGLEKNTFPLLLDNNINEYLEEKRLLYVAITRAKKKIFISYNKSFNIFSLFMKKIIKFLKTS